eukprot:scaffold79455_cov75-Phaeocystis_antarctica.AAC.3
MEKGELHAGRPHLHEAKVISRRGKGGKSQVKGQRAPAPSKWRVTSPPECRASCSLAARRVGRPDALRRRAAPELAIGARAACGSRSTSAHLSSWVTDATPGIKLTACASVCGVAAARSKLPSTCSNSSVAPTTAHAAEPKKAVGAPSAERAGAPRALGSKSVESDTLAPSDMLSATATHSHAFGCHDAEFPMESKRVSNPLSTTDRVIAAVVARSSPAAALRHANRR